MRSKNKNPEATASTAQIEVTRAKECKNGNVLIDLKINDVSIYGCFYVEGIKDGREYSFVSFPSRKADNGKFYSHAYYKLSDQDIENIANQIDTLL